MMEILLANIQKTVPSIFKWLGVHHARPFGMDHHAWVPVVMAWMVGVVLVAGSYVFTSRIQKIPGFFQGVVEMAVIAIYEFFESVLGEHTDRYMPFLGSMFLYILAMNYWPLIPGMHAPTATLSTTIALALVTFMVVQYEGIRKNGLIDYLKHFAQPYMLFFIMIPIHILEEFVRPLSLALRLFGNILGEDTVLAVFISLVVFFGAFWFPAQFPMYFITLLAGLIQAAIFTILSAIYIADATGVMGGH